MTRVSGQEPVPQTAPPVAPGIDGRPDRGVVCGRCVRCGNCVRCGGGIRCGRNGHAVGAGHAVGRQTWDGVGGLPTSGDRQQPVHTGRLDLAEQGGDLRAPVGQIRDEPVDIVDKTLFIGDERGHVTVGKINHPTQRRHECLCIVGQPGEALGQCQQQQMHLRRVEPGLVGRDQLGQRAQVGGDILQRHRLENTPASDRLLVDGDRLLGRLPGGGQLVQIPGPMEVLHTGHPGGVRVGPQVSPLDQLLQRRDHLLAIPRPAQIRAHVLGTHVHDEPVPRPGERHQHIPIKGRVRRAQMRERLPGHTIGADGGLVARLAGRHTAQYRQPANARRTRVEQYGREQGGTGTIGTARLPCGLPRCRQAA